MYGIKERNRTWTPRANLFPIYHNKVNTHKNSTYLVVLVQVTSRQGSYLTLPGYHIFPSILCLTTPHPNGPLNLLHVSSLHNIISILPVSFSIFPPNTFFFHSLVFALFNTPASCSPTHLSCSPVVYPFIHSLIHPSFIHPYFHSLKSLYSLIFLSFYLLLAFKFISHVLLLIFICPFFTACTFSP